MWGKITQIHMVLSAGTRLGHYEILSPIGAGGMGEVYCATDTQLDREVAIKILPEGFASNPERIARFEREAKVLATLNHPNIAAIYGLAETENNTRAIVMELVAGPTLADRLKTGLLSLAEALAVARQVAEALEAAHEKGVTHRDLKPANIKAPLDGSVKVLDFGLATVAQVAERDPADSPTLTMRATEAGVIMGTAGYMSPEQACGKRVDRRADIWSFGVVLYEMLTGKRLFSGETVSDTLADVLRSEINFGKLPAGTPAAIRELLRRCLDRNVKNRLRDIGEARIVLQNPIRDESVAKTALPESWFRWWFIGAALLALIAAGLGFGLWRAMRPAAHPLIRLSVDLGPDALAGLTTTVTISPDGQRLIYPARGPGGQQQFATRMLSESQPTLLHGTENGYDPFFSPDGKSVGFFAEGKLKRISIQGGAPLTLCDAVNPRGGSWGEDGNIVAALGSFSALSRVAISGEAPQRLTKLVGGEITHRWPQVLPGNRAVVFTASATTVGMDDANIEVMVLKTGATKILHRGGYYGRYLPSGYLVYVHQGVLFGAAFDLDRLELKDAPTPIIEQVAGNASQGGGQFDFSQTGSLVYLAGKELAQGWPVVWVDSTGKNKPLLSAPGVYYEPRFSPDGQRLALTITSNGSDIFVYEGQRSALTRLTFDAKSSIAVWSPDGKHIAYRSTSSAGPKLWWVRSNGSREPLSLMEGGTNTVAPWSFSSDGRRLAYHEINPDTGFDIWTIPLDTSDPDHPKPGKPEPFLRTRFDEAVPMFSPDGRWIAYRSNATGAAEIYVQPFPGPGGKWQISTGGGLYGYWSKNGRELFYETADNRIMEVDYTVNGDTFVPGQPRLWTDKRVFYPGSSNLDLAPDGKRFAAFGEPENARTEKGPVHVTFLLNFFDELRRHVPVNK